MATNNAINVATAATGTVLQGAGVGVAPVFSTATYPSTTTINEILYSSATNAVAGLATANRAVLTTNASGVPSWTALSSNGQLIIGSAAGSPAAATLTAGTGISITNASNSITIAATGGGAGLQSATVVLTSAQIKALAGTPQTLVAAQGAGTAIILVRAVWKMTYGGTNAFTSGSSLGIWYNNSGTVVALANGIATTTMNGTQSRYSLVNVAEITGFTGTLSAMENVPLTISNTTGTDFTGNAANNNTLTVQAVYYVVTI